MKTIRYNQHNIRYQIADIKQANHNFKQGGKPNHTVRANDKMINKKSEASFRKKKERKEV